MKKLLANKTYMGIALVIILFLSLGTVAITSLELLQGNSRVVNYAGIVRGATQKLVKEELMGYPDDALVARLDSIVENLLTGKGEHNLVLLNDEVYLANMNQVKESWVLLKAKIFAVRDGYGQQELYDASQEYFELVDKTVFSAEQYSETQLSRISTIMLAINGVFIVFLIVGAITAVRSAAVRRRADALGMIAYVDSLTQVNNRASCEQFITKLLQEPPEQDVWVFMFDMNNLKLTNDFLGHKGGDQVIKAFASILANASKPYGFFGRYGGDEFLSLFIDFDIEKAKSFFAEIRSKTEAYNEVHSNKLEQISYAAGGAHGNLRVADIDDIIHEADNQMYLDKRKIKRSSMSPR